MDMVLLIAEVCRSLQAMAFFHCCRDYAHIYWWMSCTRNEWKIGTLFTPAADGHWILCRPCLLGGRAHF